MHLSAASDCTRPLLSLLKTRHMQESMHRCVEGPAENLSVPSVFVCVCSLSVDQFILLCMFVRKSRLQTKHNKGERKLDSNKTT